MQGKKIDCASIIRTTSRANDKPRNIVSLTFGYEGSPEHWRRLQSSQKLVSFLHSLILVQPFLHCIIFAFETGSTELSSVSPDDLNGWPDRRAGRQTGRQLLVAAPTDIVPFFNLFLLYRASR